MELHLCLRCAQLQEHSTPLSVIDTTNRAKAKEQRSLARLEAVRIMEEKRLSALSSLHPRLRLQTIQLMRARATVAHTQACLPFYGPYHAPVCSIGDSLLCKLQGVQIVSGFYGSLAWPFAKARGHRRPIILGDLFRALSRETISTTSAIWEVHTSTVIKWRKRLKMPRLTLAGRRIKAAEMIVKRAQRPDLHVDPGTAAIATDRPFWHNIEAGRISAGSRLWTEEDLATLAVITNKEAVNTWPHRTLSAIASARLKKRLPAPATVHICSVCGYTWPSHLDHLPLKCANDRCSDRSGWNKPQHLP